MNKRKGEIKLEREPVNEINREIERERETDTESERNKKREI